MHRALRASVIVVATGAVALTGLLLIEMSRTPNKVPELSRAAKTTPPAVADSEGYRFSEPQAPTHSRYGSSRKPKQHEQSRPPSGMDALVALLQTPPEERDIAVVRSTVEKLLAGDDRARKKIALFLIAEHGLVEMFDQVLGLLSDPEYRRRSAHALGKLGDTRAVTPLRDAYPIESLGGKREVAQALAKLGDSELLEEFIARASALMLGDEDGALRLRALKELATLKRPDTLPMFVQALTDTNSQVRAYAIYAVGVLGGAEVLDELEPALSDPDKFVRLAAQKATEWIKHPSTKRDFLFTFSDVPRIVRVGGSPVILEFEEQ